MDLAQTLVRSVMRSFYETKHILVIDALIIHSALRDDDMAILMGMNKKELHKLCGKLKEDRFLAVHTRSETKEGQQRPINITYYYIDYRATIDAIKWRVYNIDKQVQGNTVPQDERKEYSCPRCKSQWTQMEVLDKVDFAHGFLCHKCGFPLVRNEENDRGGHEQSTRLNAQFRFITDVLPKIDQVIIPDNTFEVALAAARPIVRDNVLNPAAQTVPVESSSNRPTAVKGSGDTGIANVSVTITTSDGQSAAEKAAEKARKEALAIQNQMPAHFTHSTVTGERVMQTNTSSLTMSQFEDTKDIKDPTNTTPSFTGDGAEIDNYFALLKEEQTREAVREQEEEDSDDEEDEDDEDEDEDMGFEDVVPANTGTPASSTSVNGDVSSATKGVLKKSGGSSTGEPSTGAASPSTPDSARAAKKVRIEEPVNPIVKDEEESEEDVEFEDV